MPMAAGGKAWRVWSVVARDSLTPSCMWIAAAALAQQHGGGAFRT
jgi:hypothetical protein